MKGWILVGPERLATEAGLGRWFTRATDYAGSLPANDDQESAISTAQEGICAAPIAV
jgi:hypothetical protein